MNTTTFRPVLSWLNAYLPPLSWATMIFLFSDQAALPGLEAPTWDFFLKKTAHIFVYAVLYFLIFRSIRLTLAPKTNSYTAPAYWLIPATICFLYAVSDEIHQSVVVGRTATARDVGYDMLGVFIAFLKTQEYI